MSASSDNLRVLYPEFASTSDWPDATIDVFIGYAAAELEAEVWGSFFERGSLALAAHMMSIRSKSAAAAGSGGAGSAAGPITSVSTGDLSVSYASPSTSSSSGSSDDSYTTTPYGLEFIRLRDQVVGSPLYVC